jgi:hypothetical protein
MGLRTSLATGMSRGRSGPMAPLGYHMNARSAPIGRIVRVVLIMGTGEQARFEITPPRALPEGRQFRIDLIDGHAYLG